MSSESSSDSDNEVIESKAHIKKKFKCKIGNTSKKIKKNKIIILSDACEEEIKDLLKLKGNIDEFELFNPSKEALHTITCKIKKSIAAKDIDVINSKDFKLLEKHREELQQLSNNTKLKNINKRKLKEFIKETCKIGEKGKLLKVLIKLK